jgi:Tol biopolymer transport system component/tRNA A-37 threonylcarbamoyl transferase component Bud32
MSFAPGSSFSTYTIGSLLGAGGMGEVYRARDAKLGREVAIKVLPEAMAADRERRTRFAREAHLLASLNHPNIAAVYGYEEIDGQSAIVLELVEGHTLSDRLASGALAVDEAVSIAVQVSRALEAAHEKGIVHRDLKPANIRIRPDGTVKVLDFGIAKMLARTDEASLDAASASPTITSEGTQAGVIIGTAAYMSPEQSRGAAVDARTDIWAFGCVLYEMLAGRMAFSGATMSDTIAAVLTGEPDWAALPESTPQAVRRLLRRALSKDPRERLHNIADARLELQDAASPEGVVPAVVPIRRSRGMTSVAAIAIALLAGVATWTAVGGRSSEGPGLPVTRFAIQFAANQTLSAYWAMDISPDGRQVVYAANGQMFLRSLDRLEATPLGDPAENIDMVVFSPDGQSIAYSARTQSGGRELRRVGVTGGPPTMLCATAGFTAGMRWVGDRLIFAQSAGELNGIYEVPAEGGTPRSLVEGTNESLSNPELLADRDTLLFVHTGTTPGAVGSLVAYSLKSGQRRELMTNVRLGRVLPSGHLLFVRGTTASVQSIDLATLEVRGGVTVVAENLPVGGNFPYGVNVAIARNGTLAFLAAPSQQRRPVWIDRDSGRETPLGAVAKSYVYPTISPDGTRVALTAREGIYSNWVWNIANQTLSRITVDGEDPRYAIWSADSRRLFYSTGAGGRRKLTARMADGSGGAEELLPLVANVYPSTASPDGRYLVFREGPAGQFGIHMLSLAGDKTATRILEFKGLNVANTELSPDGRWIAYQEGGPATGNIVVRPFPNLEGGRWIVSQGGSKPLWSRSGRELFFLTADNAHIAAVPISLGPTFTFAKAENVFDVRRYEMAAQAGSGDTGRTYDVSPDGKRFLVFAAADTSREQIIVVENWANELKSAKP